MQQEHKTENNIFEIKDNNNKKADKKFSYVANVISKMFRFLYRVKFFSTFQAVLCRVCNCFDHLDHNRFQYIFYYTYTVHVHIAKSLKNI